RVIVCVESVGLPVGENATVPGVAATLLNDVDDATKCAAVFGLEARTLDLYFLDELDGNVGARATCLNFGSVHAFDEVGVFSVRSAVDLITGTGAGRCADDVCRGQGFLTSAGSH